jgi:hypothetical protein
MCELRAACAEVRREVNDEMSKLRTQLEIHVKQISKLEDAVRYLTNREQAEELLVEYTQQLGGENTRYFFSNEDGHIYDKYPPHMRYTTGKFERDVLLPLIGTKHRKCRGKK